MKLVRIPQVSWLVTGRVSDFVNLLADAWSLNTLNMFPKTHSRL